MLRFTLLVSIPVVRVKVRELARTTRNRGWHAGKRSRDPDRTQYLSDRYTREYRKSENKAVGISRALSSTAFYYE